MEPEIFKDSIGNSFVHLDDRWILYDGWLKEKLYRSYPTHPTVITFAFGDLNCKIVEDEMDPYIYPKRLEWRRTHIRIGMRIILAYECVGGLPKLEDYRHLISSGRVG